MDINDLRASVTVLSVVVFGLIVWRVYSRRAGAYQEQEQLPFDDEHPLPLRADATVVSKPTPEAQA
jgi:hypothetical protein